MGAIFSSLSRTVIAGVVMYLAVWLVKTLVFASAAAPLQLCGEIVAGIITYSAMTFLVNRSAVRQCLALMRMQ